MMKLVIVLLIILAFAAGLWYGHWIWRRPIIMVVDKGMKVVPHVEPGDTLIWTDQTGKTDTNVGIDFLWGNGQILCEPRSGISDPEKNFHRCVVREGVEKTPFRYYDYVCGLNSPPCTDPDAGGGSDTTGPVEQQSQARVARTNVAAVAAPTPVAVYCPSGTAMAAPIQAKPGDMLQWHPQGSVTGTWSVGAPADGDQGSLSPICGNGHSMFSDGSICTVQANASTTTYNVKAAGCTEGSGTITITSAKQ